MKNGKMRFCYDIGDAPCRACDVDDMVEDVDNFPAADVEDGKRAAWISVKDGLPGDNDDVIGAILKTDEWVIRKMNFWRGRWWNWEDGRSEKNVTHWMPLPEPPEA